MDPSTYLVKHVRLLVFDSCLPLLPVCISNPAYYCAAARQSGIHMLCSHRLSIIRTFVRLSRALAATYTGLTRCPARATLLAKLALRWQL